MNLRRKHYSLWNREATLTLGGVYIMDTDRWEPTVAEKGAVGICLHMYDNKTGLIIWENGMADGWPKKLVKGSFLHVGKIAIPYSFFNMMELDNDYRIGAFENKFDNARELIQRSIYKDKVNEKEIHRS